MKEPERFLRSAGLKATLLASAKADAPPRGTRERAALAAAGALAASTKAASATATVAAVGKVALLKWLAVGLIGTGALAMTAHEALRPDPPRGSAQVPPVLARAKPGAPRPAPAPAQTTPSSPAIAPAREAPSAPPSSPAAASTSLTAAPPPPATQRRVAATSPTPPIEHLAPSAGPSETQPARASRLSAEIAAIDSVKQALSSGDPDDALRRLDAYGAAYPGGALGEEAAAMRIEALARAGRRGEAQALLEAFERDHPDSPLAASLLRRIGGGTP